MALAEPPRTVLIVDDDPATRTGLSELLAGAGFAVVAAAAYHEAVTRLRTSPPHLLIADVRLGAYNGLQLVISRPSHVAAIVISGFADATLEREAHRFGAAYLLKPVNPRQLLVVVGQVLGDERADGHRIISS